MTYETRDWATVQAEREAGRRRGKATLAAASALTRTVGNPELDDILSTFRRLETDDARAVFADHFLGHADRRLADLWPLVYEMLDLVEQRKLYAEPGFLRKETFATFEEWFEARLGRSAAVLAELESQHHRLLPASADRSSGSDIDYPQAAAKYWGEAGAYVYDTYAEYRHLFPGLPESLPIVIGIVAYGHCGGLTRCTWPGAPRISIFSAHFAKGRLWVRDTMIHEMLHAWLHVTGRKTAHNSDDWYEAVNRLSPSVLDRDLNLRRGADRKSARDENGEPRKVRNPEAVPHKAVAGWPHAFRRGDDWGEPIPCPTY